MSTYVSYIKFSFDLPLNCCFSPWSAICNVYHFIGNFSNRSFILSAKYSLFTGLFKMDFTLGTFTLAPRIWLSFPWSSSSTIPTRHTDLDCLSSSTITTSFNCFGGRLNFCNYTLWFSLRLIRYSFLQWSQKWFRILLIFLEWTFKSGGVYDISNGSGLKCFSCLPNNNWFGVKHSSTSSS